MPWRPLPQLAFGIAKCPFQPSEANALPLQLGDELYIIEEGGKNYEWFRGYLVAPASLQAALTSVKGQPLEARVYSGVFPRNCVEIREYLGTQDTSEAQEQGRSRAASDTRQSGPEKRQDVSKNDSPRSPGSSDPGTATHAQHERRPSQRTNGPKTPLSPTFPTVGPDGKRIKPPAPVPMLKVGDESSTFAAEPLVGEIASCLREWHSTNMHELLLSRHYRVLDQLSELVDKLEVSRRQLMHGVLTEEELVALREETVWDLVKGNRMLQNDIVVRDPGQKGRLLCESDDPIEISRLQSTMSLLDQPPKPSVESFNLHHLFVEAPELTTNRPDSPKAYIYLASRKADGPLVQVSEAFMIEVPNRDQLQKSLASGKLRTLFTDLTASDIGSASGSGAKVYLIVKIQVNYYPPTAPLQPQRASTMKETTRQNGVMSAPPGSLERKPTRRSSLLSKAPGIQRRKTAGKLSEISETTTEDGNDGPPPPVPEKPPLPPAKQPDGQYVKKFVGVGLIPIEDILNSGGESDQVVSIWCPSDDPETASMSGEWNKLLPQILPTPKPLWARLKGLGQIKFHFHTFASSDIESLIRKTPTLLHNIVQSPKIGFSGAPTKPRSDIYITLTEPVIAQAASFLHPVKGPVELPNVWNMRNLQLTLEVRKDTGERVSRCIFPSTESTGQTAWRSTAIKRGEKWMQTFRLAIPPQDVPHTHLIMSIAEFSEFPFALAWIPLWSNGAFLQDGEHFPNLHLYDHKTAHTEGGKGAYLDLPWNSRAAKDANKAEPSPVAVATLKLETYLCSTHFSQDQVLLRLLKWQDEVDDQLLVLLRQVVFVPEIEIVKLVSEVFNALFGLLVEKAGHEEFEDVIFAAVVTVLGIVYDRRFRLDPIVKDYAENKFDFPAAAPCLIHSYLRLITAPADHHNSRQLRATFKVGKQIMKFIIMARRQQVKQETYEGITSTQTIFNMELKDLFIGFEHQMREEAATNVGSKTMIVQHMHTWLPELAPCFSQDQILKAAGSFLDSCEDVQGKLILHKLVLLWNILKSAMDNPSDYLPKFRERVLSWIQPYWGETNDPNEQYREQVRLCCSVVSLMRGHYGPLSMPISLAILRSYRCIQQGPKPTSSSLMLLFPSTYPLPSRPIDGPRNFDECLIELGALKATIDIDECIKYLDRWRSSVQEFIELSVVVGTSLLNNEAYPASWLTLHAYYHHVANTRLDGMRQLLCSIALPAPEDADTFNTELWKKYIMLLLILVRSPTLSLETFPEQKRRAVWKICGDIRDGGANLLLLTWNQLGWEADEDEKKRFGLDRLGGYQVQYVPGLVAPVMELCLSVHEGLRRSAVEVLRGMIVSEWSLNENLTVVQAEIIDCLDSYFKKTSVVDGTQQRMFIHELSDIFETLSNTTDQDLWNAIQDLLTSIDHLLDLLLEVHAPDQNELSRIMHTLRLMEFLKGVHKQDMFISYIHKLSAAEADAGNFTEAGLSLRLHADVYSWDPNVILEPLVEPSFPKQTAFERRESLFFEMIKFFEEDQAWEQAIICYKELSEQYENVVFDFARLARTQRSLAKIYERISRGHMESPRYFRAVYRGLGFSASLRDKTIIFESPPTEKLAAFIDRMQQQYPSATVSSRDVMESIEGQHIQVTLVAPHRDLSHPIWQRQKVPHSTKVFVASMNTRKFSTTTTRRHTNKSSSKEQSVEKMVFTTMNTFPTILRRSEVYHQEAQSLDPLETALERTLRKVSELASLNQKAEAGDEPSINNLIESIKAAVDPLSTTSVAQYRELTTTIPATPSDDDQQEASSGAHHRALQVALIDYASCIRQGLSKLSGPTHHQDQIVLSRQFNTAFAAELAVIAPLQPPTQWASAPESTTDSIPSEPKSAPLLPMSPGETITTVTANKRQSRLGGMFKRNTIVAPTAKQTSDGDMFSPSSRSINNIYSPMDETLSPASSRNSFQDKPSSRASFQSTEDTSDVPTPRKNNTTQDLRSPRSIDIQRAGNGYASQPISQVSRTSTNSKKQGSIRKRLSTLGLGRKPSQAKMLQDPSHPALVEE